MENEKKGFFGFGKPKEKILNNKELMAEMKIQNSAFLGLNAEFQKLKEEMKKSFDSLISAIEDLKITKNIPAEWQKIISEMKSFNADLPDIKTCYAVLIAYKNLPLSRAEINQAQTILKLQTIKKEADEKKIRNCAKCNKPLNEGEYYKLKDKAFCLEHKEEKPETKKGDEAL